MGNVFKSKRSRAVGTSATQVAGYSVPAATTAIVVGLSVANILNQQVTVTVQHNDGSNFTNIVANAIIPAGDSLIVTDAEKFVLETTHSVYVTCNTAAGVDVVMSILEMS